MNKKSNSAQENHIRRASELVPSKNDGMFGQKYEF